MFIFDASGKFAGAHDKHASAHADDLLPGAFLPLILSQVVFRKKELEF